METRAAMCKIRTIPVGVGALDDPRAMRKRYAQTVGRRLPPAGKIR